MKAPTHQICVFKKRVRSLTLCTICNTCSEFVIQRLKKQRIGYPRQPVSDHKVSLHFGKRTSLDIVRPFAGSPSTGSRPKKTSCPDTTSAGSTSTSASGE